MEKTRIVLDVPTKNVGFLLNSAISFGASLQGISELVEVSYSKNQPKSTKNDDPRKGKGKTYTALEKAMRNTDGLTFTALSKVVANPSAPLKNLIDLGKVRKEGRLYIWSSK